MGVVEFGITDANLDVGYADVAGAAVGESAVLSADGDGAGIRDGIAEEVRRKKLVSVFLVRSGLAGGGFAERSEGALEFAGHGVEEHGRRWGDGFGCGVNFGAVLSRSAGGKKGSGKQSREQAEFPGGSARGPRETRAP